MEDDGTNRWCRQKRRKTQIKELAFVREEETRRNEEGSDGGYRVVGMGRWTLSPESGGQLQAMA